jgi:hypothetical protein
MDIDLKCILFFFSFVVQILNFRFGAIFQAMIPEAFAIVLAPTDTSRSNTCLF